MTIADWTLLGAVLLTYAPIGIAKKTAGRAYNNGFPRDPGVYAKGKLARLWGAHMNGFETFPFFAAAVILSEFRLAPQGPLDVLAVLFLLLRVAYVWAYINDRPSLRTPVWAAAFVVNILIFVLPSAYPAVVVYLPV